MDNYKEVDFHEYCELCEYVEKRPDDEPCNECLTTPARKNSKKPVKFVVKTEKKR